MQHLWSLLFVGIVATLAMPFIDWPWRGLALFLILGSLGGLAFLLTSFHRQIAELDRLRAAYNQLDQQAKLVIKTDIELHRTQEELDRRLASLLALHTLGRQLQLSERPDQLFSKLDVQTVANFGFSKGLLGICNGSESVEWRSLVGVNEASADTIHKLLVGSGLFAKLMDRREPLLIQASLAPDATQRQLLQLLDVSMAVLARITPAAGPSGLIVLGRAGSAITAKADEELVAILSNQLSATIANSALYESAWNAQQELERKVQQRTHELADANEELIRLNKAKSNFVSAVSHELRTPLAAIKGYASLLNNGQFGELQPPQKERLGKIEKHSDLLTQFINNLLDIARIESGRVTMEQRAISLDEFLMTLQDIIRPQIDAKHINYVVERNGLTHIFGDSQHLHRVFMNLMSNAIKYTPENGEIRFGLARDKADKDKIVVSIADNGCGMSPDDLPKLFQEFYRSADPINQQVRGTGLGLALVKRIVEAHQGKIWVTSERGKGSTFFVSLPAEGGTTA